MIRVVLAVAVAVALLSASLPAIDSARVDRTTTALDRLPDRIERTGSSLRHSEPAGDGRDADNRGDAGDSRDADNGEGGSVVGFPTARRIVAIRLPRRSFAVAGVDYLALCPGALQGTAAIVYAVADGAPVRRSLTGKWALPTRGVVFSGPGTYRLALDPIRDERGRRIRVRALAPPSRGAGSSTVPNPPTPCDSSIASGSARVSTAATRQPLSPATPPTIR